jgi:hypothetical protein
MSQLINLTTFPPKGYQYFEPALNWRVSRELAHQGLDVVAKELQRVRMNNPQAGLDPSYEACVKSIGEFTCARLAGTTAFYELCGGEPQTDQERAAVKAALNRATQPRGCASCGGR